MNKNIFLDKVGSTELTVYQLILVFSPLVAIIVAFTSRYFITFST